MTTEKIPNLGSLKVNQIMGKYIKNHLFVLRTCFFKILSIQEERWTIIIPLLYSIVDSCESLLILSQRKKSKDPKVRDCFVISRTIIETIINIIFILGKGNSAKENARDHWLQKSYRDLNREFKIGDQILRKVWTGEIDLDKNPDLKKAFDKYTVKSGKENTKWTPESITKRLEFIHTKYGSKVSTGLHFSFFHIYRHASEIAHGTFFGGMFALGLTGPKNSNDSEKETILEKRSQLSTILLMVFLSISSLFKVIAKELPNKSLAEMDKNIQSSFFKESLWQNMK